MDFLKRFIFNLALIALAGVLILVLFPGILRSASSVLGNLFGPMVLLFLIIAALPYGRRT